MTDFPIIDTHLHLWDPSHLSYPWLADAPKIAGAHLLPDYCRATEGLNIEKMVFVQCEADFGQYEQEVAWVTEQARTDPRIRGIVAWAPLEKGEAAREDLDKLKAYPLMRGIRRIIQFEGDVNFCLKPGFVRGVQLLEEYNWSFDLCIKGDQQFANTLELVRQCPGVRFILDHIGKPFIKEGILEPWRGYIRELAALPNTCCKVSGLVCEADADRWSLDIYRPYLDAVFGAFGSSRVIFGGDWPVVLQGCRYREWFDTLATYSNGLSADEKQKLFHDNAAAFYRL